MYELDIKEEIRVVFKDKEQKDKMQRLILFKITGEETQPYEAIWGNYFEN